MVFQGRGCSAGTEGLMNCALKLHCESCDIKGPAGRKWSESQTWPLQLWRLNVLAVLLKGGQCELITWIQAEIHRQILAAVPWNLVQMFVAPGRWILPTIVRIYHLVLSSSPTDRSISWLLVKYLKSYWMDWSPQLTVILIVDYFLDWSFICSVCKMSENVNQ